MSRPLALAIALAIAGAAAAGEHRLSSFGPAYVARPSTAGAAWMPAWPAYPAAPSAFYGAYVTAYRGPSSFAYGSPYVPAYGYPYVGYSYPYLNFGAPFSVSYGFAYAAGTELPYVSAYEGVTMIPGQLTPPGPPPNFLFGQSDAVYNVAAAVDSIEPPVADGTARITLRVPADAEVTFQGQPSEQTGATRTFATPPLTMPATYELKVRWKADGKQAEQTIPVTVKPGDRTEVQVLR